MEEKKNSTMQKTLLEKRRRVINEKDEYGEPGIEGFWLHVSSNFNLLARC